MIQRQNEMEYKYTTTMFIKMDKKEKETIIEKANQLVRKEIVFDFPWDMETCHIPYLCDPLHFDQVKNEDEEWCFMLNRFAYTSYLVQAYLISKEKLYVKTWLHYIKEWITQHPSITRGISTRTLDTAIRCLHWVEDLQYLKAANAIDQKDYNFIIDSVQKQIVYLYENYLPKYDLSNWGSIQTAAIVCCLCRIEETCDENPIYLWALEKLHTQIALQVHEDGTHWEQSTMYHTEVLHYGLKVLECAKFYEVNLEDSFLTSVKNMAYALQALTTPKGFIDNFGDSDYTYTQDMLSYAAYVLHEPSLKKETWDSLGLQGVYEWGYMAERKFKRMRAKHAFVAMYHLQDSGIVTIRHHQGEDSDFLQINNGQYGSGHTHSQPLHISLYQKGNPFLIDSGRYTYKEEWIRTYLKSMEAHNCVVLNEDPASIPVASWECEKHPVSLKNYVTSEEIGCYVETGIIANSKEKAYTQLRKVVALKAGIYVVIDELFADTKNQANAYYHIHPQYSLQQTKSQWIASTQENSMGMQFFPYGEVSVETKPCSFTYNCLEEHERLRHSYAFENKGIAGCVLYDLETIAKVEDCTIQQDGKETIVYTAKKCTCKNGDKFIIIVFHEEIYKGRKVCFYNTIPLFGKCIVIHETKEKTHVYNLKK